VIYLDNAATSYPKPPSVIEAMTKCMNEYCANPGRGGHNLSVLSSKAIMDARTAICDFFNVGSPMQVCFTKNATEALNIAIKGIIKTGSHVITSSMEHNSVIRPLKALEKEGIIEISIVKGDEYGRINHLDISKNIKKNTDLIVLTLSSNVNGMIMPVKEVGEIAASFGIPFLLDASQGAGVIKIDMKEMQISMLAVPGHKSLYGPQGTGCLCVDEKIKLKPLMQGGTGSNSKNTYQPEIMPDLAESGTLNTPGIVGLHSGIEFIKSQGIDTISYNKNLLVKKLIEGLSEFKKIKIYSSSDIKYNSGIVAFNIEDMDSTEVSYLLDNNYDIAVRAGFHCSPVAHMTIGTAESGAVRLSPGYFNTLDEIDFTLEAIRKIIYKS